MIKGKKVLRWSLLAGLVLVSSNLWAQKEARQRTLLNDSWKFHYGNASNPQLDFNYSIVNLLAKSGKGDSTAIDPKFDDSQWRTLKLPHDWAVEESFSFKDDIDLKDHGYKAVGGLFPASAIGWYRKGFRIDPADSGRRFSITFDGIYRNAKVWINGFYLGTNESGYVGFTYDITDFINFQKENKLVVRVDATQSEGWFYEGAGIYRNVWLNKYNNVNLPKEEIFVHTAVRDKQAIISLETLVKNEGLADADYVLEAAVRDRTGKLVASFPQQAFHTASSADVAYKTQLTLNSPHLWSLEDPYLYRLQVCLKQGNNTLDNQEIRFGIRTVEVTNKGLYLNGKHIKIKGTNNHQDHAGVGSALPEALQYWRIAKLKEMGSNAYRASHHAPTPELLDACDSLGMLVMDEQRLLNSGPEYINQFERLLKRDRNRASVFMWSIGNEEGYVQTNSYGKRIALTLLAKQRQLDPSRVSVYAADLANVFHGVNEVIPVRGFNYRQFAVADYHREHPTQPLIGTEMGSTVTTRGIYEKDSVRAYVPDQDITAPWWASRAEDWWPLAAENDFWLGGFIWTGFDYRGEPTPYVWPNISSHFGVMDICGFPKNIYYYYKSWWSNEDVLHISPHWNWKGSEGKPIKIWVNSNCQTVELFLNGKTLGKKTMKVNSHLSWEVPYQAGTLSAIGYRNGRKLQAKVQTAGEGYRLVAEPSTKILKADGRDILMYDLKVLDKKGIVVPDAANLVRLQIQGNAEIIGCGNGDPSSHEPDKCEAGKWQRHLFSGKCQFIIQAGTIPSLIKITASSDGLQSISTSVVSK